MTSRHKNIFGTEMEWAILGRLVGSDKFQPLNGENGMPSGSPLISKDYLPEGVVTATPNNYLSNGARYYFDVGGHVEYATPENISHDDAVLSELAGEHVVSESLRRFVAAHSLLDEVVLYKRVIDDEDGTWGYHVNVSEDRAPFVDSNSRYRSYTYQLAEKLRPLIFHYASSLPMLGGGAVQSRKNNTYKYTLGQKAVDIKTDITDSTMRNKPFISTRDEPHADKTKYLRFHIVGTDPHISPWAMRMMMGTTSLMLAGIRQEKVRKLKYKIPTIYPGVDIVSRAMYDIAGENYYEFSENGETKRYRASDIQEMYVEDLAKVTDKTADEEWAYREWVRAVEDLKEDVMRLSDRSDAIAKLSLIKMMNRRHNKAEDVLDMDARSIDKVYTTVFRATKEQAKKADTETLIAKTLSARLRSGDFATNMPSEKSIANRVINAPTSTRAHKRGEIIRRVGHDPDRMKVSSADWTHITVHFKGAAEKTTFEPWDGVDNKPD